MPSHVTPTPNSDQTIERWLPVVGYEGIYEVSSFGRVRSLDRADAAGRRRFGRILSPGSSNGYLYVQLCRDRTQKLFRIHTLVAAAFIGKCPDGFTVNHIDGVKTNNRDTNLEYLTPGDNVRHAVRLGLTGYLSLEQVQEIRSAYSADPHLPYSVYAEKFGIRVDSVREIARARMRRGTPNADGSSASPIPLPVRHGITDEDLYARHVAGQSLNSIARELGVNVGTISRRYHRIADQLRDSSSD